MRACLPALIATLALAAAAAARGELIHSPACREALAALDAKEQRLPSSAGPGSAPRATPPTADGQLAGLRRAAARACLGRRDDEPVRMQRHAAPVAVPPIALSRPPAAPAPARTPGTAPRPPAPPTVVTACDAVGCWASDGSRLHRVGPDLQGPRGLCSLHGTVLVCP